MSVTQLGARASFLEVVLAFAVSSLLGAATPLPGGIGAVEAGLTGMLRVVAGLPEGQAAAATLVIRLVTLWFAVFIGVLELVAVRRIVPGADRGS